MKSVLKRQTFCLLASAGLFLFANACSVTQPPTPTAISPLSPSSTSIPASSSTPVPTQTLTISPEAVSYPTMTSTPTLAPVDPTVAAEVLMSCEDGKNTQAGSYRTENNTWGKGDLVGWSQCIGLGGSPDGTLFARWTWDWLSLGGNVKAYPEVIFGQKPGTQSTTPLLPRKIKDLKEASILYDIGSKHTGSGNFAFDIWLTSSANPDTWGAPPITHEIMIWLDAYGGFQPAGTLVESPTIGSDVYHFSSAKDWGDGWTYLAFDRAEHRLGQGSLDLIAFLDYLHAQGIVTGDEYVASIEFGNEISQGQGETVLRQYSITIK